MKVQLNIVRPTVIEDILEVTPYGILCRCEENKKEEFIPVSHLLIDTGETSLPVLTLLSKGGYEHMEVVNPSGKVLLHSTEWQLFKGKG